VGQGRGGLYSYDRLENLAGLEIHSVDRIIPELQHLEVGDTVSLSQGGNELSVAEIEPDRALVLRVMPAALPGGATFAGSWSFVLEPAPGDVASTRLIVRWRATSSNRPLLAVVYVLLIEVPHFVMDRAMLRGFKQRAESAVASASP
jgi:hypothetical protein